jgi:hypothetical protein
MNDEILPKDWIFKRPLKIITDKGKIAIEINQDIQVSFITRSQLR